MTPGAVLPPFVTPDAPLPTWFGVGGGADLLARPQTEDDLRTCLAIDDDLVVLGDGANLLVDDGGVGGLVVELDAPAFGAVDWPETGAPDAIVTVGAGVNLPRLINEATRRGLGGLEVLVGIPASVGGAVVMNAGGAFGAIADTVLRVHAIDRAGREQVFDRSRIEFGYRASGLRHLIVTRVELLLRKDDPARVRERLMECMAYKKRTQPLGDDSAGCVFKNPTLEADLTDIGVQGERVSAGLLLDRAGCKGMRVGGAEVSALHANFFTTDKGARARDVIDLIAQARRRVLDAFGVRLEREVVIWTRHREAWRESQRRAEVEPGAEAESEGGGS
ncbi:MAG: UDP-N-acetylmuramate dehydrogenase [Planctomycetota bacterium]